MSNNPIKAMTNRAAQYYAQNLCYLTESHGLNYMKILCLQWQSTTGNKCTKRKHVADDYSRELECEAQLTECLVIASQGGSADTCKAVASVLYKIHDDMGCSCEWQPKLKPPKVSDREFLQAKVLLRTPWLSGIVEPLA